MRQKLRSHIRHNVVGYIALFVALGGTTYAATGGNFILGRSNTASSTTSLSSSGSGPALKATNTSIGTAGSFNVTAGHPPLKVNSGTKVANLNADKLDGKDSTALLDKCPSPATVKFGRICAGSPGTATFWTGAEDYCAGLGLRLPSLGEAITLAKGFDVPGVADTGQRFWSDALFDFPPKSIAVSEGGFLLFESADNPEQTVCVTNLTNG